MRTVDHPSRASIGCLFILVVLLGGRTTPAFADSVLADDTTPVDPPLKLIVTTLDKQKLSGDLVAYSPEAFVIKTADGATTPTPWSNVDGRNVYLIHTRVFRNKATAEQWYDLGSLLMRDKADAEWSDRAFKEAVKLDPSMAELVKATKEAGPLVPAQPAAPPKPAAPKAGDKLPVPDELKGKLYEYFSPEQHAQFVEAAKKKAEEAGQKLGIKLNLYETEFVLFYTNIDPGEAREWQMLVGKMYDRMLEMWAMPPKTNVFRGKVLIYVFKTEQEYLRYEKEIENHTPPAGNGGMCHFSHPVRIAFFRTDDRLDFASTLVHETSHAFLLRYRSPKSPPNWLWEGMADWISFQLVPQFRERDRAIAGATSYLNTQGNAGGMWDRWGLSLEQYRVSSTLVDFMVAKNSKGFVAFVNAVKDNKPWRDAMAEDYGVPLDKLFAAYGQSLRLSRPIVP